MADLLTIHTREQNFPRQNIFWSKVAPKQGHPDRRLLSSSEHVATPHLGLGPN